MEKKKLGLSNKSQLELSKTVEGGTVKQSFSHGRVKSVAVEVKKVRTFKKSDINSNESVKTEQIEQTEQTNKKNIAVEEELNRLKETEKTSSKISETKEDRLKKIKEAAHSGRIERESNFSSTDERKFKNTNVYEKKKGAEIKNVAEKSSVDKLPIQKENINIVNKDNVKEKTDEEKSKKQNTKKNRADLKKQLSLGKSNLRRQTGKITVQQAYDDEERQRSLASIRRAREKEKKSLEIKSVTEGGSKPIIRDVVVPEFITVQELANRMAARVAEVVKVLINNDIAATATQTIDADTAELVVMEFGHKPKRISESDIEIGLNTSKEEKSDAEPRPPIVTVMGHVDHGKTTLLDALRNTDVVSKEQGGITQHIGAYQISKSESSKITFIDTPGHSAFSGMRARGAKLTDIVVLVVAADDGVMPQTVEAIKHSQAAKVPMIVAVNKIDSKGADKDKIVNELLKHDVVVEKLGGEIPVVEISALKKQNLESLIENIILLSELLELKASKSQRAEGTILEAKREQGRGVVASIIQQRGVLKKGDIVVAGSQWGKIRAILNDKGKSVDELNPSSPAEILGLNDVPIAGDEIIVVESEARAREVSEYRKSVILKKKTTILSRANSMENILKNIKSGEKKILNVVIKVDALGSKEAIMGSIDKIGNEEVDVQVLLAGVGGVTETDVALASSNEALIIGFNVRADLQAKKMAKQQGVTIKYYSIIYEIFDEIRTMLSGMLPPLESEKVLGYADIKQIFKISKLGKIAGCFVTEGIIKRGTKIRVLRDNVVLHTGELDNLKRHSNEAKEVSQGMECGISIKDFHNIQENDRIECFDIESTPRDLEEN